VRASWSAALERAMSEPTSSLTLIQVPPARRAFTEHVAFRRLAHQSLIGVALLYLFVVLFAPLIAMAIELTRIGVGEALRSLLEPEALSALRMSMLLTLLSVVINSVVGIVLALAIVRQRFALRKLVNALADLPLAVSPVMVGLSFLLLFGRDGWFASTLEQLDVKVVFAFGGLLLGTLFVALPYTVREIVYVLEELGTSEEEAAATLGASPAQIFFRVTLPNIRFALGYGVLMTLARSMGEFGAVLVLGGSISGQTQTATTFIHDSIDERKTGSAYGMAVLLAMFSIGLLLALEWAKRRRKVTT
jgi:sulfate/thiosulfate transport system permease protein